MTNLANKITAFLDKHAMEPTRMGILVANDGHLIHDLFKAKRRLRRATVRKIEDFMRSYNPRKRK